MFVKLHWWKEIHYPHYRAPLPGLFFVFSAYFSFFSVQLFVKGLYNSILSMLLGLLIALCMLGHVMCAMIVNDHQGRVCRICRSADVNGQMLATQTSDAKGVDCQDMFPEDHIHENLKIGEWMAFECSVSVPDSPHEAASVESNTMPHTDHSVSTVTWGKFQLVSDRDTYLLSSYTTREERFIQRQQHLSPDEMLNLIRPRMGDADYNALRARGAAAENAQHLTRMKELEKRERREAIKRSMRESWESKVRSRRDSEGSWRPGRERLSRGREREL